MTKKKRWSYDCKGRVLTVPNGITVVPYEQTRGGWYAVVVDPGPRPECQKSYPRGGYNIVVSDKDVQTAIEHTVPADTPENGPLQRPRIDAQHEGGVTTPGEGDSGCMKYGSEVE